MTEEYVPMSERPDPALDISKEWWVLWFYDSGGDCGHRHATRKEAHACYATIIPPGHAARVMACKRIANDKEDEP